MKLSGRTKKILLFFSICLLLPFFGSLCFSVYVHNSVKKYSFIARKEFPGEKEDMSAMIRYILDKHYTLENRNNMIWAIGRLSNIKALPFLEAFYTGEPCSHSSYLCQYELSKAINRCGGNVKFKYKDKKYNR